MKVQHCILAIVGVPFAIFLGVSVAAFQQSTAAFEARATGEMTQLVAEHSSDPQLTWRYDAGGTQVLRSVYGRDRTYHTDLCVSITDNVDYYNVIGNGINYQYPTLQAAAIAARNLCT